MNRKVAVAGIALLLLLSKRPVSAQVTLTELSVEPPVPTTTDNIVASVSGMVNVSESPAFFVLWKREASSILVDVLHDFIGAGAPPVIYPYTAHPVIGSLPAGDYNLTARLFSSVRDFPPPTYEQPWRFPASDIRLKSTLSTTFTVVPEPATIALSIASVLLLVRRRK
jgi:hypothetical protein